MYNFLTHLLTLLGALLELLWPLIKVVFVVLVVVALFKIAGDLDTVAHVLQHSTYGDVLHVLTN